MSQGASMFDLKKYSDIDEKSKHPSNRIDDPKGGSKYSRISHYGIMFSRCDHYRNKEE